MPPKSTRRQSRVRKIIEENPVKSKASLIGIVIGLLGCGTIPVGGTIRLLCGTATGVMDIVDKVNANNRAQNNADASPASTLDASVVAGN